MRSLAELVDVPDPAWPELRERIDAAPIAVAVVPATGSGEHVLHALQVSAASTLGALALSVGAVVCDHGWLRMLGAGAEGLPSLAAANDLSGPPAWLTVAHDVLGGQFAIDGGGLADAPGEVCYFGPDTLEWTPIGGGHTTFVHWALGGGLTDFYAGLRWPGWEQESAALRLDQGISLYPPPFTKEGRDPAAVSRRVVPLQELLDVYPDYARQLAAIPEGSAFRVKFSD